MGNAELGNIDPFCLNPKYSLAPRSISRNVLFYCIFFLYVRELNRILAHAANPLGFWRYLRDRAEKYANSSGLWLRGGESTCCLSPFSLFLSLPSVCFRLDKPCSARSHFFCPKCAAARPADCENKRLHSAPRGNTTGGGSNDNICTVGVSLSTLFLVPGYIGDTSPGLSPVREILKKESFVFPRSVRESFCPDGSNILLERMGYFMKFPFKFLSISDGIFSS